MHGLELTADDLLRRLMMHMLICNSILSFESIETVFPIDYKCYFATELVELLEYEESGLLTFGNEEITITPKGRLLVCSICMVFDKYQQESKKWRYLTSRNQLSENIERLPDISISDERFIALRCLPIHIQPNDRQRRLNIWESCHFHAS